MKYVIALLVGYYLLEGGRHFVRQVGKWDTEDSKLPLTMQAILMFTILGTCLFWPFILLFHKKATNEG